MEEFERDLRDRLEVSDTELPKNIRAVREFVTQQRIRSAKDFTSSKAVEWLMDFARKSAGGKKTALNMRSRLRRFSEFLRMRGLIDADPMDGLRLPRAVRRKGSHPFTAEEVSRLIEVAETREASTDGRTSRFGPLASSFYGFLALTGLRFREANMQAWADIDLRRATMTVTSDKARRRDALPLNREAVALLRIWRKYSRGEKVFPQVPSHHTLTSDMRAAGIERDGEGKRGQWHRLRKCAIRERAKAGADGPSLTKFARHTSEDTTRQFYDLSDVEELRAVAELMPRLNGFLAKSVDLRMENAEDIPATNSKHRTRSTNKRKSEVLGSPTSDACGGTLVNSVGDLGTPGFRQVKIGRPVKEWSRGESNPRPNLTGDRLGLFQRVSEVHTQYLRLISELAGGRSDAHDSGSTSSCNPKISN